MVRVKSLPDPLPLHLDGVPVLRVDVQYIRSLGASPGFCKYQDRQGGVQLVKGVLVVHLITTFSPDETV